MSTTDLAPTGARPAASASHSTYSPVSIVLLIAFGALLIICITAGSWDKLLHGLPILLIVAVPVTKALRGGGGLGAQIARDPHVFALASIIAMSGPVAAGTAYYLSGSFGLEEAGPAILAAVMVSGVGMLALLLLTAIARRVEVSPPASVLLIGLTPILFGILLALGTPTADEELNAIFEPHFGLSYEAVRTAYIGYEIFPEPVFEANFGMTKTAFFAAWVKIRADVPEFQHLRLPGGEAI